MRFLTLCSAFFLCSASFSQQVLFSEDFEGLTPAFTLNTTDVGSLAVGANTWLINNVYTGGDGDLVCLGFPLPYTIVSTPGQPGGITSPNGKYMHTASVEGITDGITCCSFAAPDLFDCITTGNYFTRMSSDISTVGYDDIDLSFWWLCNGATTIFGEVYYSIDGGASWILIGTPIAQYNNQGSWVQQTVSEPQFGNQATLRFGFRFVTAVVSTATDPGFGIDDVRIIADEPVPNSITAGTINPVSYCQGAAMSVPYTAGGTYTAGNIFSAELSDAAGSFASPTVIGTLSSTVSGTISCTIPALTPVGTGYRVRVVSSAPVVTGTPSAADISVSAAPFAGNDAQVTLCKNTGIYDLLDFMPGASDCGGWTGPTGASFSGQLNSATDNGGLYTYTTNCAGGCPQDMATLNVNLLDPANAGQNVQVTRCETDAPVSLITYVQGGDLTGIFFYEGNPTTGTQLGTPGVYNMIYVVYGTSPCVNDTADFVFVVNAAADAGTDVTLTVCPNDPAVQLFNVLGGTPQPGGTWTDPVGDPFTGLFNPAIHDPGLYTYLVNGVPPCPNVSASVAVVIDPCTGIDETVGNASPIHWLGQEEAQHLIAVTSTDAFDYAVFDPMGRQVVKGRDAAVNGIIRVPMSGLASGVHVLQVRTVGGFAALRFVHIAR